MEQYLQLLRDVVENGTTKDDRTGTGVHSVFGRQLRFDLRHGFPLLTTKKLHWHSIVHELLWFLRGETNLAYLHENKVRIWDEWADENGDLGPIYGKQWRAWSSAAGEVDQLRTVLQEIRRNADSRRLLVSAWNVGELPQMRLAPCHVLFQFYVARGELSCQLYQRSADVFLGVPFNIASYALLTHLVAALTNLKVGEFVHTFGDVHLYRTHRRQAAEQLQRTPLPAPRLHLSPRLGRDTALEEITAEDIALLRYEAHPNIPAKVAV